MPKTQNEECCNVPPEHGSRDRDREKHGSRGEKKRCLGYRLPGIVGAEMGKKGIFGRIAVVFFSMFRRESLGVSFVLLLLLSLADGGLV